METKELIIQNQLIKTIGVLCAFSLLMIVSDDFIGTTFYDSCRGLVIGLCIAIYYGADLITRIRDYDFKVDTPYY